MNIDHLASETLNCAFRVHSALGPGLLESAYEACFAYELTKAGIRSLRQVPQPIVYDNLQLDEGYRLDILIEDALIVEVKAVEAIAAIQQTSIEDVPQIEREDARLPDQLQCAAAQRRPPPHRPQPSKPELNIFNAKAAKSAKKIK